MTEKRLFGTVKGHYKEHIVDNTGRLYSDGEVADLLNELSDENEMLKSENDSYRNMFFEIVESALTDKNCRELYCKGILDIFDKANSLNQAREMIKEHLK